MKALYTYSIDSIFLLDQNVIYVHIFGSRRVRQTHRHVLPTHAVTVRN